MRVIEKATLLRLCRAGQTGGPGLGSKVCLSEATPLNEDLDCEALSATTAR